MTVTPRLKIAIGSYGHTRALKTGAVPIEGIDPDFVEVAPIWWSDLAGFGRVHR